MKFTKNRLLSLLLVLAMMLALVPTVFAEGETPTTTPIKELSLPATATVAVGAEQTLTLTKTPENGTGTIEWTSSDPAKATVSTVDGVTKVKGLAVTEAEHPVTITAKVSGSSEPEIKATCALTVTKGTAAIPTLAAQDMPAGSNYAEITARLDSVLAAAEGVDKFNLSAKWSPETIEDKANDKGKSITFTKTLTLKDSTNYQFANAEQTSVSCVVNFREVPNIPELTTKVNGKEGTSLKIAVGTKSQKLSVDAPTVTPDGTTLTYQWYKTDSTGTYTESNKISCTDRTYTLSDDDVKSANTYYYVCVAKAEKDNVFAERPSAKFTVTVVEPYRVDITPYSGNPSSPKVGNTLTYTATVKVYDPTNASADSNGYRNAVTADNLNAVTFSTTGSDGRVSSYPSGNTCSVYLYGARLTSANTLKLTAALTKDGKTYSKTVTNTYYPATASNITLNPTSSTAALMDETSILSAVNSAVGSSIYTSYSVYRVNFTTSTTYGSFSTTGASSSTYSQNGYVSTATYQTPKINSVYFVPNSSYVGFPSTSMYVTYYAYDSTGYVLATGNIYFTSASSITYSTTASTPVYFKASDFSDYFKTALGGTYNSSYYTLSEVTFGTPRVSNSSVTSGTLYYNNGYVYSTTKVPAANLGYVSYTPSSSTYTYTVSIPFTAYGTYGYTSTNRSVSGTVTIKVNDGHVITMVGTDFKSASIWSDITSKHPGVSYVSFSQPQSTVGKLYYGYSSIASKGSLVSYTDRFNNSNYNYSYANTIKSIDGIYFVPAADCLDTVTLTYTAYTSATATTGVSDTITFTITKKTASSIFNDVTASNTGKWSADAIDFLARNSIVEGGSYGTFNPNGNMTRGDFVLMLYRLAGKPSVSGISNPFTDVKSTDYYYNAILWAYRNDIVTGVDAKTFAPKKNITREQIAATLYRMAGSPSTSGYLTGYYDYAKIHSYATNAMRWAISNGVITGSNGYLTPTNNATRAQVATMLHRYLTK